MTIYGAFSVPTLGMKSQAYALTTIGNNLANVHTGGFKRIETRFSTVMSEQLDGHMDMGGNRPKDTKMISQQGLILASEHTLDVAINGDGFFVLNADRGGGGQVAYTRDGAFKMTPGDEVPAIDDNGNAITVRTQYLTDKNGYYVMGRSPEADGTFSSTGTPEPLRVDRWAFSNAGSPTTEGFLALNLDGAATNGQSWIYHIDMYDDLGASQSVALDFTRAGINTWTMDQQVTRTPVAQVDTLTIGGTVEAGDVYSVTIDGNTVNYTVTGAEGSIDGIRNAMVNAINTDLFVSNTVTAAAGASGELTLTADLAGTAFVSVAVVAQAPGPAPVADNTASIVTTTANIPRTQTSNLGTLVFSGDGTLSTPSTVTLSPTFDNGGTANVTLDLQKMTQYAGAYDPVSYERDGYAAASLNTFAFDEYGHIVGEFTDGTHRNLYKLPLATFTNPNGLEIRNGNVFFESPDSGIPVLAEAGGLGFGMFSPNSHEISNVDIADEMTRMIMTQTAYNSSATVFKTVDEMTRTAGELKR